MTSTTPKAKPTAAKFKSPLTRPAQALTRDETEKCAALTTQVEELEKELDGEDPEQIVQGHIKLLHEYNEIKDAAQSLLGRLAALDGVTAREVHQRFGLDADN